MHYYNAKSKVIMKGGGSRGVRRSRRGGQAVIDIMDGQVFLGGGKRPFLKRTCRSKSRCGGAAARVHLLKFLNDDRDGLLGGRRSRGVRGVRRSRRGGRGGEFAVPIASLGGSRDVRRSRRGGQALIDGEIVLGGGKRTFRKRTCRSKSRCGGSSWSSSKYSFLGGGSRGVRGVRRSRRGGRGGAYDAFK